MKTGYSGRPLVRKLGIKEGFRIKAINEPDNYWNLLGALPANVSVLTPSSRTGLNLIHLFVKRTGDLKRRLPRLETQIVPDGAIWVSWPSSHRACRPI